MHVRQYPWLLKSTAFRTIYCSESNTFCTLKCHCWREQAKTVTKGFVRFEAENHTCAQASRNTHPRCSRGARNQEDVELALLRLCSEEQLTAQSCTNQAGTTSARG